MILGINHKMILAGGVDGTTITLPNTQELREAFGLRVQKQILQQAKALLCMMC